MGAAIAVVSNSCAALRRPRGSAYPRSWRPCERGVKPALNRQMEPIACRRSRTTRRQTIAEYACSLRQQQNDHSSRRPPRRSTSMNRPQEGLKMKAVAKCLLVLWFGTIAAHAQILNFQHIVVIVQENRTPDNLFQGLCTFCTHP